MNCKRLKNNDHNTNNIIMNNILKFNKKTLFNRKLCSTKPPNNGNNIQNLMVGFGIGAIIWSVYYYFNFKSSQNVFRTLNDELRKENELKRIKYELKNYKPEDHEVEEL